MPTTQPRPFPLSAILSVAYPVLLCDIREVSKLLAFLSGDDTLIIEPHEPITPGEMIDMKYQRLSQVALACGSGLVSQHRCLLEADPSTRDPLEWREYLARQERLFGKELMVKPLVAGHFAVDFVNFGEQDGIGPLDDENLMGNPEPEDMEDNRDPQ